MLVHGDVVFWLNNHTQDAAGASEDAACMPDHAVVGKMAASVTDGRQSTRNGFRDCVQNCTFSRTLVHRIKRACGSEMDILY